MLTLRVPVLHSVLDRGAEGGIDGGLGPAASRSRAAGRFVVLVRGMQRPSGGANQNQTGAQDVPSRWKRCGHSNPSLPLPLSRTALFSASLSYARSRVTRTTNGGDSSGLRLQFDEVGRGWASRDCWCTQTGLTPRLWIRWLNPNPTVSEHVEKRDCSRGCRLHAAGG